MASKQSFAEDERQVCWVTVCIDRSRTTVEDAPALTAPVTAMAPQALFESDDKDHSGDISWEEFSGS